MAGSTTNNIAATTTTIVQRETLQPSSSDRVSTAPSSVSTRQSESSMRQFPITKTFGRASWATRSWYGRSWHGKSWHASQTFAPPMSKLPDPPPPPPPAKYSVFPRMSGVSSIAAGSSTYGDPRMTQTGTTSFYGTGLRPAPGQAITAGVGEGTGQVGAGGGGGGAAAQMEVPQVVIYSATPRVSAQTPVIVDPDYSDASAAHSREASQASMHSGSSSGDSGGDSPGSNNSTTARDGSRETIPNFPVAIGTGKARARETQDSLVEVTDIPRRPVPPPAAVTRAAGAGTAVGTAATTTGGPTTTTLSRFSQVSDLSSASANTGYSWDEGASEPYTADRASMLSRMGGGFGLSIVGERNTPHPLRFPARPGNVQQGTAR